MLEYTVLNNAILLSQCSSRSIKIDRVPEDNCRDHKIEPAGPVALLLVGAVPDLAGTMEADCPR